MSIKLKNKHAIAIGRYLKDVIAILHASYAFPDGEIQDRDILEEIRLLKKWRAKLGFRDFGIGKAVVPPPAKKKAKAK